MTANIRLDGNPSPQTVLSGATVALTNFDNTGVLGWDWTLVDRPIGSSASIASPTSSTASLTVDIAGTYIVRLRTYTDAARTLLDDSDRSAIVILFTGDYPWRIPAASETTEVDTARGWAQAVEAALRDLHAIADGGVGGAGSLQEAYTGGFLIETDGNNGVIVEDNSTDVSALELHGLNVNRDWPLLYINAPTSNPSPLIRLADLGGAKMEILADTIQGDANLTLQPTTQDSWATVAKALYVRGGSGGNGSGEQPGGNGADLHLDAGSGGPSGGAGAGTAGVVRIANSGAPLAAAQSVISGTGATEWEHDGTLVIQRGAGSSAEFTVHIDDDQVDSAAEASLLITREPSSTSNGRPGLRVVTGSNETQAAVEIDHGGSTLNAAIVVQHSGGGRAIRADAGTIWAREGLEVGDGLSPDTNNKATFYAISGTPTPDALGGHLYAKVSGSFYQLFYMDSNGLEHQLTGIAGPTTEAGTTRTLTDADHGKIILCTHASGCAVTVPHTLSPGFMCFIRRRGGSVTFAGSGGLTVTPPTGFLAQLNASGSGATVSVESATVAGLDGDLAV